MTDAWTLSLRILWLTVLAGPPIAWAISSCLYNAPTQLSRTIVILSVIGLVLIVSGGTAGFRFTQFPTNVMAVCFGYLFFCVLSISGWHIRSVALRILLIGYGLCTLGFSVFALVVTAGNGTENVTCLDGGFSCGVEARGHQSDGIYSIRLYREISYVPFVVQLVAEFEHDPSDESALEVVTCAQAYARYKAG